MLAGFVLCFYGTLAVIAFLNLALMRRPVPSRSPQLPLVLIPARDEEANLRRLLPSLLEPNPGLEILVFNDESSDQTAEVSAAAGATVVQPSGPLPFGWTGKNRACHELAVAAASRDQDWWLFLDADVRPGPDFIPSIQSLCENATPTTGMITGFPHVLAGSGIEPMFLAWVGWILLSTNPYGLINRTGIGHSRFKNGQIHCWRREVYERLRPNEAVKGRIMEDVMIGRLLAKEGVAVEVANLSKVIQVLMYTTWKEAFDGMSKNSYEITNSVAGSLGIALFFLFAGWAWLLAGHFMIVAYGLFLASGIGVCLIARTVWWPILLAPLIPTIGAITVLRSTLWHHTGAVRWKGRTYTHTKK